MNLEYKVFGVQTTYTIPPKGAGDTAVQSPWDRVEFLQPLSFIPFISLFKREPCEEGN